jgi:hypothetical protein
MEKKEEVPITVTMHQAMAHPGLAKPDYYRPAITAVIERYRDSPKVKGSKKEDLEKIKEEVGALEDLLKTVIYVHDRTLDVTTQTEHVVRNLRKIQLALNQLTRGEYYRLINQDETEIGEKYFEYTKGTTISWPKVYRRIMQSRDDIHNIVDVVRGHIRVMEYFWRGETMCEVEPVHFTRHVIADDDCPNCVRCPGCKIADKHQADFMRFYETRNKKGKELKPPFDIYKPPHRTSTMYYALNPSLYIDSFVRLSSVCSSYKSGTSESPVCEI